MIVVREVFKLHYGKAREAIALVKEMSHLGPSTAATPRVLTDVVGRYYTLFSRRWVTRCQPGPL